MPRTYSDMTLTLTMAARTSNQTFRLSCSSFNNASSDGTDSRITITTDDFYANDKRNGN